MALGTAVGLRESAVSSLRMYFEMAAERIGLHPEMRHLLSVPFRELTVELPLRRDDGKLQLFRGHRVQHNGVRGPLIGPMRIQADLEPDTLRATAESMTWRCAAANVPFGGAAGAIGCDSDQLSSRELERLVRRYISRVHHVLGIFQDVCSPGANAGSEVMGWISSEHSSLQTGSPATAVGRPAQAGGLAERDAIVGRALATLILHVAHDQGMPISGLRVALQAADQSGIHTALALVSAGCEIVAIGQEGMCALNSDGLDVDHLARQFQREGVFGSSENGFDKVYGADCDLLAIAAPECTLTGIVANEVHAKIVLETSELVVSPTAERNLASRNVVVIPDLVSAAGTVLVANAEWSSIVQKVSPSPATVEREIEASLIRIYQQAQERSRRENISLRMAAYCSAIERVARSERLRVA